MLTIVHTASADPNPWWMLDTEKETEFGTVVVYVVPSAFRKQCASLDNLGKEAGVPAWLV